MRIGYAERELEGDWALFTKIAGYFVNKVLANDREDFLHDLLVEMAKVKAKYEVKGKTLTEAGLMRVASYELKGYWDKRRYRLFGLNCTHCTSEQRQECHMGREPSCPKGKAYLLLSLDQPVKNDDGDELTKLRDLIAYDRPVDLDAKLDARCILQGLPTKLVRIGYKIYAGIPLEPEEKKYIQHRRETQHPARFYFGRDHLDERILELLRKNAQGLTRGGLSAHLHICIREVNRYLVRLIRKQQVITVKRENTRGRPRGPLFLIAGAEIPEEKMVKEERDERIRQAYFKEGRSIKRIKRELHHDKRTIHRAIRSGAAGTF